MLHIYIYIDMNEKGSTVFYLPYVSLVHNIKYYCFQAQFTFVQGNKFYIWITKKTLPQQFCTQKKLKAKGSNKLYRENEIIFLTRKWKKILVIDNSWFKEMNHFLFKLLEEAEFRNLVDTLGNWYTFIDNNSNIN